MIHNNRDLSILRINRWLGINENPDGDTQLRAGEAAEMRNFRITQEGNLQLRPGMRAVQKSRAWSGEIRGIWHGRVGGESSCVFAAGGALWLYDFDEGEAKGILAPDIELTDAPTTFFGFSDKLYILNGHEYLEWDGSLPPEGGAVPVEGYRPLIQVATSPDGGGTQLEQINKLTGQRRLHISPDGAARVFRLPERGLKSIDYVRDLAQGRDLAQAEFTHNLPNGTVSFNTVPVRGVNTFEIGYSVTVNFRAQVEAMRFCEFFNGGQDNRVFIYGDGTNKAFYTGIGSDGAPRADYFPDLNELDAGAANTPITGLIRHNDHLAVFKSDSAYSVRHGTVNLEDGRVIPAFYLNTVNRAIGNLAYGQVELIQNSPRTLFASAVYEWTSGAFTDDERQSRLISRRAHATLSKMNLAEATTFDDNEQQEYYIIEGGAAVIHSYATDTWFVYRDFDVTHMLRAGGRLYGTTKGGDIVHISRRYYNDDGRAINALWRSGAMSFDRDWQRKYISRLFVTMKPEPRSSITAAIRTNRNGETITRAISQGLATFSDAIFRHWSFGVNRQPQTRRFRIKAKKLTFMQLAFESSTDWSTATILAANVRLMYAGDVRG